MEGGNSTGSEECGIGSIVWVRRRNGSWWPGKILGPDELSATHLMSPRSGTPVKLLGRQDASVDWYNLEKSKRVKAFRCGEFNDCIERAESSLGMPPKKREKYARREDAILHALELEREMLENQGGKLSIPQDVKSSSSLPSLKARSVTPSGNLKFSGKLGNSGLEELPTGVDSYPKDLIGNSLHLRQQKEDKELYTDGNSPGNPIPMITGTSGFERHIANDSSIVGYSNGVISFVESSDRGSMSSELLIGDSSVTRPDRRHPLAKVMQNNAKSLVQHVMQAERQSGSVSMPGSDHVGNIYRTKRSRCTYQPVVSNDFIYDNASCPQMEMFPLQSGESYSGSMSEESTSGSTEDTKSDSSETEDLETDSDEEMRILSGKRIRPDALGMSEAQRRNLSNHVSDELALMQEPLTFHARYRDNANTAVSKWKMKGKRNTRHLTKSSVDVADIRSFGGTVDETYLRLRGGNLGKRTSEQRLGFHHKSYDSYNGFDETDFGQTYTAGFDNRGHSTAKRACRGWNSRVGHDTSDWDEMAWEDQPSLRGYADHSIEYFDPSPFSHGNFRGRPPRTLLIEVDLKVQASYQKERVPIVSLMSKLDGKAIIGHPIQIEALEDGSSEMILSRTADIGNETHYSEGDATLPPVWRTARRTANYRVSRPDLSSALDDDESEDYLPLESKQTHNRLNTGRSSYGGSLTRKGIFQVPRPPGEKKPVGRPPKRVSLSLGQKTRTLSSFSNEHKFGAKCKRDRDSYLLQGLIKSEAGSTTVACIPLKLVYSRLYEAVGRPPASVASNHEALVNMNTETG